MKCSKLNEFGTVETILDRWSVFGHYNRIAKFTAAQMAFEPYAILHAIILSNQTCSVCPRRNPFQTKCEDPGCPECRGQYLDLTYCWSNNLPAMIARGLIGQLPIKREHRRYLSVNFGNIRPDMVDWDKLERSSGTDSRLMFFFCQF